MQEALTIFYTWAANVRQAAPWQAFAALGTAAALAAAGCFFGYRLRRFFAALTGAAGFALCGFALYPLAEKLLSGPALPLVRYGAAFGLGLVGLALAVKWPRPFVGVCGGVVMFFLTLLFCTAMPSAQALAIGAGAAVAGTLASIFWTKQVFAALMTAGGALTFPFLLDALLEKRLQPVPYLLLAMVLGMAAAGIAVQLLTGKENKRKKAYNKPQPIKPMNKQEKLDAAAALFARKEQPNAETRKPKNKTKEKPQVDKPEMENTARANDGADAPLRLEPDTIFFTDQEEEEKTAKNAADWRVQNEPVRRWACLCGAENRPEDAFCTLCATPCPPQWGCPQCGGQNLPGIFFCKACGAAYNLVEKQT